MNDAHSSRGAARTAAGSGALALGALGVVFGDIGTSPLYAFREAFEHHELPVVETNALGVASIAFWALIVVISIKYIALVMRADNHGEGGILALTAVVMPESKTVRQAGALRFGFMEEPDVPTALAAVEVDGARLDVADATYFIGRESVIQGDLDGMHPAFEHLFVVLNRGADSAARFFKLPTESVFEVGTQVEI